MLSSSVAPTVLPVSTLVHIYRFHYYKFRCENGSCSKARYLSKSSAKFLLFSVCCQKSRMFCPNQLWNGDICFYNISSLTALHFLLELGLYCSPTACAKMPDFYLVQAIESTSLQFYLLFTGFHFVYKSSLKSFNLFSSLSNVLPNRTAAPICPVSFLWSTHQMLFSGSEDATQTRRW